MRTIDIVYNGQVAVIDADSVPSGQIGSLRLRFRFSDEWEPYIKTVVFVRSYGSEKVLQDENGECEVPAEYLKIPGDLSFGVFGTTGDESIVRYVGEYVNIRISDGAVEDVTATGVTAYDQLLWEMASKLDRQQGTEHVGKVLTVGDDGIASPQYPAMKEWTKLPTFYKEVMTSGDFFVDVVKLDISKDLSDIPLGLYYDSGVNDSRGEKPYYYGTGVRIVDGEAQLRQLVGTGPLVNINMITDEKIKITFFGADLNPQVIYTFDRTNRTLDASWIDSLSRMKTVELLKKKVDIAQGTENAGRILQMDKDGNVVPSDVLAEKMDTHNPVGTGSFSMNRKAETDIGDCSHAEGSDTTASGDYSHAEGRWTTASGFTSHAEGNGSKAVGYHAHAEGSYTTASGDYSHAEGNRTTASGIYAHAEGVETTASGDDSHAEGSRTVASGDDSHTEGSRTVASGKVSHAEGQETTADGQFSHAEGAYTTASGRIQHVQGTWNVIDSEDVYSHIVGNGANGGKRSNAHTLDWQGNAWYAGDVYVGSTSGTNRDEGSKKLATEDDVREAIIDSVPDWDQYDSTAKDFVKNRTHCRELLYQYPYGKVERLTEQIQKIAGLPRDTDYYLTQFRTYFDFDAFQSQTDFSVSEFYMKWPIYSVASEEFRSVSLEQPEFIRLAGYQFEKIDSINWRMSAGSAGSMSSKAYLIVVLDTSTLSTEYIDVCSSVGLYLDVREYDGDALFTDVYTDIEVGVRKYVVLDERYIPSSIARTADIENLPKTNEEEIAMLIETDTLPAVQNADGKLLSTGGKIIMRH